MQETVEVELPVYYRQDVGFDGVESGIYGMITDTTHASIHLTERCNDPKAAIKVELSCERPDWRELSGYLDSDYSSSKEIFLKAYAVANAVLERMNEMITTKAAEQKADE